MNYLKSTVKASSARVIGIDPGLRHTGWAIIDHKHRQITYVASGVINTKSKESMPMRLVYIYRELYNIMNLYSPQSAGIEETYVNKNYASSLKLAHARGAALVTLCANGIEVSEYSPKTVKKTIVGKGNADKGQLSRMLAILIPNVIIKSEDESDALAIAICHALHS